MIKRLLLVLGSFAITTIIPYQIGKFVMEFQGKVSNHSTYFFIGGFIMIGTLVACFILKILLHYIIYGNNE